jgi:hypothetical protein
MRWMQGFCMKGWMNAKAFGVVYHSACCVSLGEF